MKTEKNKFDAGAFFEDSDLSGKIFCSCAACMSVYSEFLSWANAHPDRMTENPEESNNIVVLSCQVTDLAVLNDLRTLEMYMAAFPGKRFFIGGCLAKRFDIELPEGVGRLDSFYSDRTFIENFNLVNYEKPFWVPEFKEDSPPLLPGHLFRKSYPLRIGVGCEGSCTYCTIRTTRGPYREITPAKFEFDYADNIVLIADNPSEEQLIYWCDKAQKDKKPISLRNVEPKTAVKVMYPLVFLSKHGLLKHFHCPIQHTDKLALQAMGRKTDDVKIVRMLSRILRTLGVITATNIIIDYLHFKNPENLNAEFDYISWNPYWDGVWNRGKAEERFKLYIGELP